MTPELEPLISLWRNHRTALDTALARQAELVAETGAVGMTVQRHHATLPDLERLIHRMEGGAEALSEAGQALAEERLVKGRKDKPAPSGPTVPMAALAENPPARVTPIKASPAKPAGEAPK